MYYYKDIKGNKDDESLEKINESIVTFAEFPLPTLNGFEN